MCIHSSRCSGHVRVGAVHRHGIRVRSANAHLLWVGVILLCLLLLVRVVLGSNGCMRSRGIGEHVHVEVREGGWDGRYGRSCCCCYISVNISTEAEGVEQASASTSAGIGVGAIHVHVEAQHGGGGA